MRRSCEQCGAAFDAQRKTAKYCGGSCRANASKGIPPTVRGEGDDRIEDQPEGLIASVVAELEHAGRLETVAGQLAVSLATRISMPGTSDGAVSGLSKELRATMDKALEGAGAALSPMDELRARRDAKRGA